VLVYLDPLCGCVGRQRRISVRLDCGDDRVAIEAAVLHVWHFDHVAHKKCLLALVQVELHPIDCKALRYSLLRTAVIHLVAARVLPTDYKAWRHWKPSEMALQVVVYSLQRDELAHIAEPRYREEHALIVDETGLVVRRLDRMCVPVVGIEVAAVDSGHVTDGYRAVGVDQVAVEDEPRRTAVHIVADVEVRQGAEVVALPDIPGHRN
jgi:hypothetical protein